jgi:osmotically inducible protein OsmC
MPVRTSIAKWEGALKDGHGTMSLGSGAFEGQYSFSSRFEEGTGTNPEELIGAAHAGCFSMSFANTLAQAGHAPRRIETAARVHLERVHGAPAITRIELATEGEVPGIDADEFQRHAESAKSGCPVSKALAGVEISLQAHLLADTGQPARTG